MLKQDKIKSYVKSIGSLLKEIGVTPIMVNVHMESEYGVKQYLQSQHYNDHLMNLNFVVKRTQCDITTIEDIGKLIITLHLN